MLIKLSVCIKCFTLWNCKWKFNLFKGQISNIFSLTNAECRSYMILLCTFWMVFWFGNVPKIGVRKLIICLLLLRRFDGRVNLLPHFPESTMGPKPFWSRIIIIDKENFAQSLDWKKWRSWCRFELQILIYFTA